MEKIKLSNGLEMPKMLFGTFQMNNNVQWEQLLRVAAKERALGFDAAPSYHTETILANAVNSFLRNTAEYKRGDFFIQTKIDAWMMINGKGEIRPYVQNTLNKTKLEYFDLILIHWPQPDYFCDTWKSLEKVYENGLAKAIGICNCKKRHLYELIDHGANYIPMVIQNEIHPFNTENELLKICKDNNIVLQAYSPLFRMLPQLKENELLNTLAEKYRCSIANIVIAWHLQRGVVPIVKTSTPKRMEENLSSFLIELEKSDMDLIDLLNDDFRIFLDSRCCPGL